MACHVNLALGRLAAARRHADQVANLVFFREQRHVGLGRRIEVEAMAGDFEAVLVDAALFEQDWRRSGRPVTGNLAVGAYAAAMVFGMIGDEAGRKHWTEITIALLPHPDRFASADTTWRVTFDALLALHLDDPQAALKLLERSPDAPASVPTANRALWVPWYAAAWAEASVLAGHPEIEERFASPPPTCTATTSPEPSSTGPLRSITVGRTCSARSLTA